MSIWECWSNDRADHAASLLHNGRCEIGLDINRHGGQTIEHLLHGWSHHTKAIEQVLRLGIIAFRFERHDLSRQRCDRVRYLRLVDGEGAAGKYFERARIEQVVQLHRNAAPVSFIDSESN